MKVRLPAQSVITTLVQDLAHAGLGMIWVSHTWAFMAGSRTASCQLETWELGLSPWQESLLPLPGEDLPAAGADLRQGGKFSSCQHLL